MSTFLLKSSMANRPLAGAAFALLCLLPFASQADSLKVYAAASLGPALEEIASLYESDGLGTVTVVAASSSSLARQIENGAPADLFISANAAWVDYLDGHGLLLSGTRRALAGNRLVLVAPKTKPLTLKMGPGLALAEALGNRPLAICDPEHVPCGIYAREALEDLNVWETLAPKAIRANNARVALAWVARGEAAAGIVYASDASSEPGVVIIGLFPPESHAPIIYEMAVPKTGDKAVSADFIELLTSFRGQRVLKSYGFTPPSGAR